MADAVATLTVTQSWTDGKRLHVVGKLSISPDDYTTGGIALSLINLGVNSLPIPTIQPVVVSDIVGLGGYYGFDVGTLYQYRYQDAPFNPSPQSPNSFLAQGVLRIFLSSTELSPGAIPAEVLKDTIKFYGIFQKT